MRHGSGILGPSLFGHPGLCWASIGLRFSAALQQPAAQPGTPAPHRCAGRIGPPIARRPGACACGVPASPPLGPCGTCRGCFPAIDNGPKIGPRWRGRLYINLFGIAGTLRGCFRKMGRTTGPGRARTAGPCHAVLSRGVVPRPAHAVAPALRRENF